MRKERETFSSAILAGGKSSRMGENKALMELGSQTVIERITMEMRKLKGELALIANEPATFQSLGLPIYSDRFTGQGPLAGIETALYHLPEGYVSIAACDTPFLSAEIYAYLRQQVDGKEAVIPSFNGRIHPLSGIYHTSIAEKVRECLENGELKIKLLLEKTDCRVISSFSEFSASHLEQHFFNMNNPSEYEQVLKVLVSVRQANKNMLE